ncbi:MAG: ABC transporter substrate-binding protein [Actinobacteria bacterium]|nr:ABC transporter substrate-binding protein [Actinomycetota bacterium]
MSPSPSHLLIVPDLTQLSRRSLLKGLLVGGATVGALAACAPSSSSPTATGTAAVGADTGAEIDLVTIALPGSLSSLDVNTEAGILNYYVAAIAQEGLLQVEPDGTLTPALAKAWNRVDASTYVFTLRTDATFADGTPVTVEDVLYSIEKARDPKVSPGTAWAWGGVDTVTQTGADEITIALSAPNVAFEWNPTAAGALFVTSKAFFEKVGTLGTAQSLILGSGPYKATAFVPDSYAEFERVETWWGGVPKVKKVRFEFIADENARLLARQSGDVDLAYSVPIGQLDQWRAVEGTRIETVSDRSWAGILFDVTVAPFDDAHVRTAIAHACNRQNIVDGVLKGNGEVALGLPAPSVLTTAVSESAARSLLATIPQYDFDLDAATAALAKSSVPDGFTVEWTYPNSGPQLGRAAQAIAADLATIGITVNVVEKPLEQWLASIGDGVHGLSYMWYFPTTCDPGELVGYLLGPGNPGKFTDDEVTAQLASANSETDPTTRTTAIIAANAAAAKQVAQIPLWWGVSSTAVDRSIGLKDYGSYFFVGPWGSRLYAAA